MGAREFGQLVEAERLRRGWTRSKLAVVIGVLGDGSALDATQVRRIVEGTRKLDQDTVGRIIEALRDGTGDVDPAEWWDVSDIKPPHVRAEHYRKLGLFALGGSFGNCPVPQLGLLIPLDTDRRRRDRRRRLPAVAAWGRAA